MISEANQGVPGQLIARILAGEKHLFHDLIRPLERSIYFLIYALLKNEAEAEDAAQETAIKVFQNLNLYRGESKFRTWVLAIAQNEGLSRLKKVARRREDSLEQQAEEHEGDYTPAVLTSWREVPSVALENKELASLIRQAIEGLPEIYRNVLVLRDVEELNIRETAELLGVQESTVKVRLHRARLMLQHDLAPKLNKEMRPKKGFWSGRR